MNKTLSSSEAKIALISLIVFLVICSIIAIVIVFFLVRNNKIKKIKKQADSVYKFLSSKTTNGSVTISRFKSVAQSQGDYKKHLSELVSLNDEMKKIYKPLFAVCNQIKANAKKRFSDLKLEFDRLNDLYAEYKKLWDKFNQKSEKFNIHWGIVDSISSKLSSILLELEKYIYKNKSNLTHTYNLLAEELDELQKNNFAFEDKKINVEITNVSAEINEYEKRVYSFCKKVDVMVKLEKAIFEFIPKILESQSFDYKFENSLAELKNNLKKLQNNFTTSPYQELLRETKAIYFKYFTLLKHNKLDSEFKSFIKNKFSLLKEEIEKINNYIDTFISKTKEESFYKNTIKQDYLSTIVFWENLVKDFEVLKNKVDNDKEIELLELQTFLEEYSELLKSLNKVISKYDYLSIKSIYDKIYLDINNQWCHRLLNLRDILEKLFENNELFRKLILLNKEINKNFSEKQYIDLSSELWTKWTILLCTVYKKVYTQYVYKSMIDALMKKMAQLSSINGSEIEEYMLYIDSNIVSFKFKEAFELLAAAIKGK